MKYLRAYMPFYGIYYLLKNDGENLIAIREESTINYFLTAIAQGLYIFLLIYLI